MSPVHTLNNLALVVWGLLAHQDFTTMAGNVVAAGLDTDCNGATAGGLWGISGVRSPTRGPPPGKGVSPSPWPEWTKFLSTIWSHRTVAVAEALAMAHE